MVILGREGGPCKNSKTLPCSLFKLDMKILLPSLINFNLIKFKGKQKKEGTLEKIQTLESQSN